MKKIFTIIFLLFSISTIFGDLALVPVSYKGRIRPLEVYTKTLFYDFYNADKADSHDVTSFGSQRSIDIISKLYLEGWEKWQNAPFFWVDAKSKKVLKLPLDKKRYSYLELKNSFHKNLDPLKIIVSYYFLKNNSNINELSQHFDVKNFVVIEESEIAPWNQLKRGESVKSLLYNDHLAEQLIKIFQKLVKFETFKGIESVVNVPLYREKLKSDPHFHLLPGRYEQGEWLGINALTLHPNNFTLYNDDAFQHIRKAFFDWEKEVRNQNTISQALLNGYLQIVNQPFLKGANQASYYPSVFQLWLELKYYSFPLIQISLLGFLLSLFFLVAFPEKKRLKRIGICFFLCAFFVQFLSLIMRSVILMRPPVSNMFETVVYVPFIGAICGMFFYKKMRSDWPLIASALLATILLTLIEYSDLNRGLENVPAVLNSNFWLTIHVLMIVGSYGILILAGIFGHIYLLSILRNKQNLKGLEKSMVQSVYLGTALLIPGTILGGIWAAQSWGRFWDWDPKESWAFISICTYLILIHLYRFKKIEFKGLSFGTVVGLVIISFTWYGVNYILGTGMHTYGFGSGSHLYYLIFLLAESFFLIYMALRLYFRLATPLIWKD